MQIQLVSEEGLNRGFDVTVPATDFETRVDTNLAGFAKDLKLPGFRPGKVPQAVIRHRYRASIMEEVMNETVQEAVRSALEENKLSAAAPANVTEIKPFDEGEDIQFSFSIDIMPSIELTDFSKLAFDRMNPVIEDRHLDEALKVLSRRGAQAPHQLMLQLELGVWDLAPRLRRLDRVAAHPAAGLDCVPQVLSSKTLEVRKVHPARPLVTAHPRLPRPAPV